MFFYHNSMNANAHHFNAKKRSIKSIRTQMGYLLNQKGEKSLSSTEGEWARAHYVTALVDSGGFGSCLLQSVLNNPVETLEPIIENSRTVYGRITV